MGLDPGGDVSNVALGILRGLQGEARAAHKPSRLIGLIIDLLKATSP